MTVMSVYILATYMRGNLIRIDIYRLELELGSELSYCHQRRYH